MPKLGSSDREGGVFSKVKSKLGFGGGSGDDRDSRGDYDDYGDYGDYEDYDYDDYDDDRADDRDDRDRGRSRYSRSSNYDDYDDYSSGSGSSGYSRDYDSPSRGGYNSYDTGYGSRRSEFPNLVTRDDVKMSTPLPEIPPIEPIEPSEGGGYTPLRTSVDNTTTSYSSTQRYSDQDRSRGEGLDSLFGSPTAGAMRTLRVIKPVTYEDAEGVVRGIKGGAVVVIALRNTPDDLGKRILDFSFGAAAALDANVEFLGDKVFAIAKGRALDEAEKKQLRNQGVL